MNQHVINGHITNWLEPSRKKLLRSVDRSAGLRRILLTATGMAGCTLMLSPVIALLFASASSAYLYYNIEGPLDWFLLEVSIAISLFSAFLTFQLFTTRLSLPGGIRIDDREAPDLHSMLERRVIHFKAAPINEAILTPNTELTLQATPRWPIPLFHTNTLCVGAPLLFFISSGQFRLALAGAIASHANTRRGLAGWAIQAAQDWPAIIQALESHPSLLSRCFLRPASWIASITTVLAKGFHTDWKQAQSRWVLENTDEQTAMDYLANQVVAKSFLNNKYWPMIYKAAERCPVPVVKPFDHFELLLEKLLDADSAKRWLLHAQAGTGADERDLRDILADLSLDHLEWSALPASNAFYALFSATDILKSLDGYWQKLIEPEWTRRHTSFQKEKNRFEHLQKIAQDRPLRGSSALRYVKLAPRFLDGEQAISVFRDMYQVNRDSASLCFACGQEMLRSGLGREGYEALQRASELDRSLARRAHALINAHKKAWIEEEMYTPVFVCSA